MNDVKILVCESEKELKSVFDGIDSNEFYWSQRVLDSFRKFAVNEADFAGTTGYGFNDVGRDKIENIYADLFNGQSALVRSQIISGTHAITISLFGILRPGDTMLCISGDVYDTLWEVIGLRENNSSLKSFGINYEQIDLINDDFDYDKICEYLKNKKYKIVYIQRSKGYSTRKSLSIDKIEKVIKLIKSVDSDVKIVIDNCYTEFVENKTVIDVGANIAIGSLIKNLGGTITSGGGYVVGDKELIDLISQRLTVPGEGKEIGPSLNKNREILMGLFHAPKAVAEALKVAILTSKVMNDLGYEVEPKFNDSRVDIVQNIIFKDRNKLIDYCRGIQFSSPIDSSACLEPMQMPGYDDEIIMASGSFTSGSSIELSCDGPLREPYIAYQQGATTYAYGKLALINAIEYLENKKVH